MRRRSFPCDPNRLRLLLDEEELPAKQHSDLISHLDEWRRAGKPLKNSRPSRVGGAICGA